jgi:predicted ribosome quality control (RQC) complex YloA/Tae2 family protein
MLNNYYTLRALAEEWKHVLAGHVVTDVFSQSKGELNITFEGEANAYMLRVSVRLPHHFVFLVEGHSRARRNVATVFEDTIGRNVTGVRIALRDRVLYLDLEGEETFQVHLYGPRANILLVDDSGKIVEAFRNDAQLAGEAAPTPHPAPRIETLSEFEHRWPTHRRSTEQAITTAFPLFDRVLAAEVMFRAGVKARHPSECTGEDKCRLFDTALALTRELEHPSPRIYWNGEQAEAFSLIPLHLFEKLREEPYDSVNAAVAVFARRMLARESFQKVYEPLERALASAAEHYRHSAEQMLEELAHESRADRYERWAHLLMAQAAGEPSGSQEIIVPDLFDEQQPVTIPLDTSLDAVSNAQQYYERARRTRQARSHAEERLVGMEQTQRQAEALLEKLRLIRTTSDLEAFRKEHAPALKHLLPQKAENGERIPFRQYALEGGYEVWVGKNAQQNDLLTFQYAQKHDLWMHARGVAGSHAVLRLPNRNAQPGHHLLERAASIAAWHSKARGSGLAPVIVVPRKYVRKAKGGAPGAVIVEREKVLLVEPGLPGNESS